jgi:hypothetical protein
MVQMTDTPGEITPFLSFLVLDDGPGDEETMGALFRRGDERITLRQIPAELFKASLQATISTLSSILTEVADESMGMHLHEAQIGFEVSSSGGIQLVGTAQAGTKGAMTLVFRRD